MEQWKKCKIRDIVEVNAAQYTSKDNWEKALYLDTGNITENKIDEMQEFDCSSLPSRARRKVKHGDIIFSTVRPNQKHYGYITNPVPNLLVSTGFAVISVNQELANSKFIYYWLSQDEIVEYLHNIAEQSVSAYPSIKASDICNLEIKLPPLEYQSKVASILSTLENKISLNRRINGNLEQQAQALFKAWFVDFEPFKDGKFVDSELGMIPKGWRVVCLSEVTKQVMEKVGNREDVTVLSPVNSGELVLSDEYFTKQVFSKNLSKYLIVNPLSFAYNPARINIGSIGLNTFDFAGCVSPVYVVFECEPNYHYFFDFYKKTKTFKNEVALRAIGGVRQSLGYNDFSLIKTIYPTPDVVTEFNKLYLKIREVIKQNTIQNDKLISLRDILLPELMSGKLKINALH